VPGYDQHMAQKVDALLEQSSLSRLTDAIGEGKRFESYIVRFE
jgi:hypothetical protein